MNTNPICPECRTRLPANAPENMCPACLLGAGLQSEVVPDSTVKPSARVAVVLPEELAPYFPNLEIIELLGRGGMGTVYKARQKSLNRLVALKIINHDRSGETAFAERFQREAHSLARLNHPNIVTIFEFGESNGLYYLLMEYVNGDNLRAIIQSGKMRPEAALALIPAFCDALQYAHDEGVVHRDIKPENVIVDKKGRVKICDFGLAKLLNHETTDVRITFTGTFLGTPRYMAPEQMERPEAVDHRSDIYSLGVVFYEMLTGEVPAGRFPPPSEKVQVDLKIDEIVMHAMEMAPERRYQHASEVKSDLENRHTTAGRCTEAPSTTNDALNAPARWQPGKMVTVAGLIGGLICIAAFFPLNQRRPTDGISQQPQKGRIEFPLALRALQPKIEGLGQERMPGFAAPGPVLPSSTTVIKVAINSALARDLRISRLHYSKNDSISIQGKPGFARIRSLQMWVPSSTGIFSQTELRDQQVEDGFCSISSSRPLPDGVYCLHTPDFRRGQGAPAFATPFVIGGISKFAFGKATAVTSGTDVQMSLQLVNEGTGEFNEGQVVITLQKENPAGGRSIFTRRWEELLPVIPAGTKSSFVRSFDTSAWEPGEYHFYGHAGAVGAGGDTDKFEDFNTNTFELTRLAN